MSDGTGDAADGARGRSLEDLPDPVLVGVFSRLDYLAEGRALHRVSRRMRAVAEATEWHPEPGRPLAVPRGAAERLRLWFELRSGRLRAAGAIEFAFGESTDDLELLVAVLRAMELAGLRPRAVRAVAPTLGALDRLLDARPHEFTARRLQRAVVEIRGGARWPPPLLSAQDLRRAAARFRTDELAFVLHGVTASTVDLSALANEPGCAAKLRVVETTKRRVEGEQRATYRVEDLRVRSRASAGGAVGACFSVATTECATREGALRAVEAALGEPDARSRPGGRLRVAIVARDLRSPPPLSDADHGVLARWIAGCAASGSAVVESQLSGLGGRDAERLGAVLRAIHR